MLLFAILYLGGLLLVAIAILWSADRLRARWHRQSPTEQAAAGAPLRQRLETPQWSQIETVTGGRVSGPLRQLYSDRELLMRTDFWILDPLRSADPAARWHINYFQPADAMTLDDEWGRFLPKGAFAFATDYVGDLHFVVLDANGRDGPVMHWFHDGGGIEEVAPSLATFLAWPRAEEPPAAPSVAT